MGIMLGWGPCLGYCLPPLVSYIAGTQKGFLNGLKTTLLFSISRIIPYLVFALIASLLGQHLIRKYYDSTTGIIVYLISGIFISFLGMMFILGENPAFHFCKRFKNNKIGIIPLGFLIGISPCIPLFGILTYIATQAKTPAQGIYYGACFSAGTLLTPLIPLGIIAGGIPSLIIRKQKIYTIFSRLCGLFMVYLGIRVVSSV